MGGTKATPRDAKKRKLTGAPLRGSGRIVDGPPLLTSDGKLLCCVSGNTVLVKSVASGRTTARLQHHNNKIVSIAIVPGSERLCVSFSVDGVLAIWNLDTLELDSWTTFAARRVVGVSLLTAVKPEEGSFAFMAAAQVPEENSTFRVAVVRCEARHALGRVEVTGREVFARKFELPAQSSFPKHDPTLFDASADGQFVALACGSRLLVANTSTRLAVEFQHFDTLTSLRICALRQLVAVGDSQGRMHTWYALKDSVFAGSAATAQKDAIETRMCTETGIASSLDDPTATRECFCVRAMQHWHAHAVASIAFTDDGIYMLTVGEEGVLVFFHLAQNTRAFLPRLGAPILHLSVVASGEIGLACLGDNSICIVDLKASRALRWIRGFSSTCCEGRFLDAVDTTPSGPRTHNRKYHVDGTDVHEYAICGMQGTAYEGKKKSCAILRGPEWSLRLTERVALMAPPQPDAGYSQEMQLYDVRRDLHVGALRLQGREYVGRSHRCVGRLWQVQQAVASTGARYVMTLETRSSVGDVAPSHLSTRKRHADIVASDHSVEDDEADAADSQPKKKLRSQEQFAQGVPSISPDKRISPHGRIYALKFWKVDFASEIDGDDAAPPSASPATTLVNQVYNSHSHDVTACQALDDDAQGHPRFVTWSLDSTWKVWEFSAPHQGFACTHSGGFKGMPCLSGAALADAVELVAASHGSSLSLSRLEAGGSKRLAAFPMPRTSADDGSPPPAGETHPPHMMCASVHFLRTAAGEPLLLLGASARHAVVWEIKLTEGGEVSVEVKWMWRVDEGLFLFSACAIGDSFATVVRPRRSVGAQASDKAHFWLREGSEIEAGPVCDLGRDSVRRACELPSPKGPGLLVMCDHMRAHVIDPKTGQPEKRAHAKKAAKRPEVKSDPRPEPATPAMVTPQSTAGEFCKAASVSKRARRPRKHSRDAQDWTAAPTHLAPSSAALFRAVVREGPVKPE